MDPQEIFWFLRSCSMALGARPFFYHESHEKHEKCNFLISRVNAVIAREPKRPRQSLSLWFPRSCVVTHTQASLNDQHPYTLQMNQISIMTLAKTLSSPGKTFAVFAPLREKMISYMHSHAGAWERGVPSHCAKCKKTKYFTW